MTRNWTETEIAAWVDGALENPAEAVRISAIVETDAKAARLAERIRASNQLLGEAFDAPMREPVPSAIATALAAAPERVAVLGGRPGPLRRWPLAGAAMAATIAFSVGLGTGLMTGGPPDVGLVAGVGAHASDAPLARALETLPSGTVSEAGIRPMLTFRDADNLPCREFETTGATGLALGIACRREAGRWTVEILVAVPETDDGSGDYVPASGPSGDALAAVLDALGAGPSLSPDAEAALIAEDWSSAPD